MPRACTRVGKQEPTVARRNDRQGYQQAYADDEYPYRGRSPRGYKSTPGIWGF